MQAALAIVCHLSLVERIIVAGALNEIDVGKFYGGDEKGYTDYPTFK